MRRRIVKLAGSSAFQIAAAYFVLAGLWIVLSDTVAARLFPDAAALARVSQYKGLGFVAVTTLLLYAVLRRRLEAMEESRRAVEASERRFAAFMDNLPVAAFLRDRHGRYVYANRYWIDNLARGDEWVGRTPQTFFDPNVVKVADEDHARILAGEPIAERVMTIRIRGQDRTFLVRRFPVPAGEELLVGAFAVDITEQRRLEEHLRQAARMETIGLLASGVAHDFNNLLAVITGYSGVLAQPGADPQELARASEEIRRAADRASHLISQLLMFSRRPSGRPLPFDLNGVIDALVSVVEKLLGSKIRIVLDLEPSLPPLQADRSQAEQILMNLIVNARDAMPSGGTILISTRAVTLADEAEAGRLGLAPGRYARLTVRDEGHGMDAETQARIFEPFFTTKEPGRGTGLGLTSVYGIVKSCGGAIRVESAPGAGTKFEIDLPAADGAAAAQGDALRARILLVEDDDAVRLLTRQLLEHFGYEVADAPSAARALEMYASADPPFRLLVTDVSMPEMDGIELVRRLRRVDPALRALLFTGYSEELSRHPADLQGVPVLPKPFSAEALAAAVREALGESAAA
jgi:two-component system cell cycle sensor histidine kinase/response regulator CckA